VDRYTDFWSAVGICDYGNKLNRMKKYPVLIGVIISMLLLFIATSKYPGGSQFNKNAVGYDWKNNYISNLFGEKAVNGEDNASRFWLLEECSSFLRALPGSLHSFQTESL
jgi:hypothetical protein